MAYDNNSYGFNYDIKAKLYKSKTGEFIKAFNVREYGQETNGASFAAGGVASGDSSYVVATNEDVYNLIVPWGTQVIIDGTEYKVLSKGTVRSSVGFSYGKPKKETVIYLG